MRRLPGRRWRRREPSSLAVRKVLLAATTARAVDEIAAASIAFALVGFAVYLLVYPSGIVLFEALVWSIEAMAFLGVALALRVAASRAAFYRARYEILRVEALAVSVLSVVGSVVVLVVIVKAGGGGEPSPLILSVYPLSGALASYVLERFLESRVSGALLSLVSIEAIRGKLRYDVAMEAAGGLGIVAANLAGSHVVETAVLVVVGGYVLYGLAGMAAEHLLYLIGPGPWRRQREIRDSIRREAGREGLRVTRLRVEVYGTFAEAEVWVAMEPSTTLHEAHRRARLLAARLVHRIPELLRVVIVPVPAYPPRRGPPGRRYERRPRADREGESRGSGA